MGYMTEFSILNDQVHSILDHPEEFTSAIYDACRETYHRSEFDGQAEDTYNVYPYQYCSNFLTVSTAHHADDLRVYISRQNSFYVVSPWTDQYKRLAKRRPDLLDFDINELEAMVKGLKRLKKQLAAAEEV